MTKMISDGGFKSTQASGIFWRNVLRHYLQVQAFCCVLAVLTMLIWPGDSYFNHLAYSTISGLSTWGVIEFGRLLVPEQYCRPSVNGGHGWPKGWRGFALTAAGIGAGFMVGNIAGNHLLGRAGDSNARDWAASIVITVLAGAVASFYFYTRGQSAWLQARMAEAHSQAAEARLKLLQTQLEPHMLFNTLANLRALIASDPTQAQHMLDHLIAYLRATLSASRSIQHPLADEFARLADYLELMAVRMGPRLQYAFDLPETLRDVLVPPLLLQPLVENAIRHGLEPQVAGGRIDVQASLLDDGERIQLAVRDTGAGLPKAVSTSAGFGLQQVRERLATLYDSSATLELVASSGGGTSAIVTFPLQHASHRSDRRG